jgi:parvulin-like peptidyl-prolyl isomerase
LAKKKRTTAVPVATRLQSLKQRKERQQQLIVTAIGIAVVAVIAGLTAFGVYISQRGPGGETAVEIGETSFSTSYLLDRTRMVVSDAVATGEVPQGITAVSTALTAIEEEEVMAQQAHNLGLAADSTEIENTIAARLGVPIEDTNAVNEAFKAELNRTGLSQKEYRRMIEGQVLKAKVTEHFNAGIPTTAEQVKARLILVATQADAQNVIARLDAGEDFGAVAQEVSADSASKESGGDIGWIPRGLVEPAVEEAIFGLQVGQRTGPIDGEDGVSILKVEEKAADRPISDQQRSTLGQLAFADWMAKSREIVGVNVLLNPEQINWVIGRSGTGSQGG